MTTIEKTLEERGTRYGVFAEHARITQNLKRGMIDSPNWARLADDQRECLEMLAHKIGRILNGDPDYHDSWHDLIGYTKLVADRLAPAQTAAVAETFFPLEDVFTLGEIEKIIDDLNREEAASIDLQALNHPHLEPSHRGDVAGAETYQNETIDLHFDVSIRGSKRLLCDEQMAAAEKVA